MKISLLTIWHDGNYGAEMQAYATIKILKQLGHDVEMIDIRLSDKNHLSLRGRIGYYISILSPYYRKFNSFWRKHIPTTRRFRTLKELQDNPPIADAYVVGSDQVWNPTLTKDFRNLYFLDFGDDDVKRISYASSFGTDKWNHDNCTEEIRRLLERFSAISSREISGVEILKEIFNVHAVNVLDPTLLFNGYPELTGKLEETKNLVYYPLSSFPELEKYSNELANRLGLNSYNVNWHKNLSKGVTWNRNSIENWVKDIAEAKFVITPSFHGLAFSLIYHRQFAIIVKNKSLATRITSLLRLLELEDRVYESIEELDNAEPWNNKIDYEKVDKILSTLREKSISFLKEALN